MFYLVRFRSAFSGRHVHHPTLTGLLSPSVAGGSTHLADCRARTDHLHSRRTVHRSYCVNERHDNLTSMLETVTYKPQSAYIAECNVNTDVFAFRILKWLC
jgi:hypothetical protein